VSVEQGPDVEVNTYAEDARCFATKRPWVLSARVEDVPGAPSDIRIETCYLFTRTAESPG